MADRSERAEQSDPPACAFVTEHALGAEVLRVFGEVDLSNAADLKAAVLKIVADCGQDIVIDLTACDYMDSSGLGALVAARRANPEQVRLVVPRRGAIHRIFEITGLSRQFRVFETVAEALATIPQMPAVKPPA